jgi:hypothetical protein
MWKNLRYLYILGEYGIISMEISTNLSPT